MLIKRTIQRQIEEKLFKGKIIVIYGPRQVGKTTLLKELQKLRPNDSIVFNCDEPDIREAFTEKTSTHLKALISNKSLVLIDEAQRVRNIGLTLKLLADTFPEVQVVATGSSSFDLSNQISEPLTGRALEFTLYPFSFEELLQQHSSLELNRLLDQRIVYGMYPEIVLNSIEAETLLSTITKSYLYKDVLQFQRLKYPEVLDKLLKALALQIGNEVSFTELSNLVGLDQKTIEGYVRLLEQAFVVFRLPPYSTNARNELKKMRKIYFYDTGIRNALIRNLNPTDLRQDGGALWENVMIAERMKFLNNHARFPNRYFWRTHQGAEVDYLEEERATIQAFEFKNNSKTSKPPKSFTEQYPNISFQTINRETYQTFLGITA